MPAQFQSLVILPAAGRSQRMGAPKLLLPWDAASVVIEAVLATWRASRVNHVLVVVHPEDHRLGEVCRAAGATVVVAPTPPPDMKASLLYGIQYAARELSPGPGDAWFASPADLPRLRGEVIDTLLEAFPPGGEILAPRYGDRVSHPLLLPWPLAAEVATLGETEGINVLTQRHGVRHVPFPADWRSADMDTPQEYDSLREQKRASG